jgi:hypothetical protein
MEPVADALCHLIADVIFREAAEGVGIVKGLRAPVPVKKPYDLNKPAMLEQIAQVAGIIADRFLQLSVVRHLSEGQGEGKSGRD